MIDSIDHICNAEALLKLSDPESTDDMTNEDMIASLEILIVNLKEKLDNQSKLVTILTNINKSLIEKLDRALEELERLQRHTLIPPTTK